MKNKQIFSRCRVSDSEAESKDSNKEVEYCVTPGSHESAVGASDSQVSAASPPLAGGHAAAVIGVGVVKTTSPGDLDRAEDFFVVATEADIKGLNRYKVTT